MHTPVKEGVLSALGNLTTVREVAFVSEEHRRVLATTLAFNPGPGTVGSTAQALTPVHKSRIRFCNVLPRYLHLPGAAARRGSRPDVGPTPT